MFFLTHSDIKLNLNKIFLAAASVHLSKNKELIGDGGGEKNKHNNKPKHHLSCLRPLIRTSVASDHQTRRAYLQQMPPAILS